MRSLIAPTDDFIKLDRASLTADFPAGGTNVVLTVDGNGTIAEYDYIGIGVEGTPTFEIQAINAATTPGTSLQVATLIYAHKRDEPIVKYRYNQIKFYGSLTLTGSYSELTTSGSPKNIDGQNPQGTLLEYSGGEGYIYFKTTYFNSHTSEETDIDDSPATLADESSRYCSLYAIRKMAGFENNPFITDSDVEEKRKEAENEVKSYIMFRYVLPLSEVPGIISRVTTLLAAGYLDYGEYLSDGQGVKWIGEARGILNSIKKGTQRLLDSNDQELQNLLNDTSVVSYPDRKDDRDGPVRMFTTRQRF